MEPKILMIGRRLEVVNILVDELKKSGRDIEGAIEQESIEKMLLSKSFDFVIIGAGLPDHQRDYLQSFIQSIRPELQVFMHERKGKNKPLKLINFTNNKAIEFKIEQELAKKKTTE